MRRDQLEHAIRAACDVSSDTELYIVGSQAILGQYPEAPDPLRASIEVDLQPKNLPETTDMIDGVLGELSRLHETHGFYVHGIWLEGLALPGGWEGRTIPVCNRATLGHTGHCLEAHDLAASKLGAFREKDREFVTTMLAERLANGTTLLARLSTLPVEPELREKIVKWTTGVLRDLESS